MLAAILSPPDPEAVWHRESRSGKGGQWDWLWLEYLTFIDNTNHVTTWTSYSGHSQSLNGASQVRGTEVWAPSTSRSVSKRAHEFVSWAFSKLRRSQRTAQQLKNRRKRRESWKKEIWGSKEETKKRGIKKERISERAVLEWCPFLFLSGKGLCFCLSLQQTKSK